MITLSQDVAACNDFLLSRIAESYDEQMFIMMKSQLNHIAEQMNREDPDGD